VSHPFQPAVEEQVPQHVRDWWEHGAQIAPAEPTHADDVSEMAALPSQALAAMRLTTLADLRTADLNDDVEWLVDGLLPKVGCAFVAAPPKHLKSWLLLDLMMAITGAGDFLGKEIDRADGATVLYLAGEGRAGALRWRLNRLLNGRGLHPADVGGRVHLSICPDIRLDEDPRLEPLRAALDSIEPTPSAVILDPLTRLHGADENSRNEVEPILTALRRLSEDYKTLVILAHHSRKNQGQGNNADPLRGSSSFRGWHDSLIWLESIAGDESTRVLRAELRDAEPFGPVHVKLVVSDLAETAEIQIVDAPDVEDKSESRRRDVVEFLLAHGPKSGRAIRERIHCSGATLKSIMSELVGEVVDGARIEAVTDDSGVTVYQAVRLNEQESINGY